MCEKDSYCACFSKHFLISVNLLSAVIGLFLCAGGAYLWAEYNSQFNDVLFTEPIVGVIATGLCLYVFSIFGLYGVVARKKFVLIAYVVIVILLIALEVAASLIFLQFLNIIETSKDSSNSDLHIKTEIAINNFMFRSYMTCCVQNEEFCNTNNTLATDPLYCWGVNFCQNWQNQTTSTCIVDESADPSFNVGFGVCTVLSKLSLDGQLLVATAEAGNDISCGGGNARNFEKSLIKWLKDNIAFFGYSVLSLGIIEVLIVVFAISLIVAHPEFIPKARVISNEDIAFSEHPVSIAIPVERNRRLVQRNSMPTPQQEQRSSNLAPRIF